MACGWQNGTYLVWTAAMTLSQCGPRQAFFIISPPTNTSQTPQLSPDTEVTVALYPRELELRGGLDEEDVFKSNNDPDFNRLFPVVFFLPFSPTAQ